MKKIIVVGAGASGMMAAGQAALGGADVTLVEKTDSAGKKIIISGKGRCNLTNDSDVHEFISHFNRSGRFLHQPFSRFFAPQLMEFFTSIGVNLITERGRRVFPASGKAHDVVKALLAWLNDCNVDIRYDTPVTSLIVKDSKMTGIKSREEFFHADAVILATGGSSYPATGSSGDGYTLAQKAGHTIIPLRPALVPMIAKDPVVQQMAGLDLKNAGLRIFINGKKRKSDFGEVGFTRFGIGGPLILTHSLFMVDRLREGKKVEIALDLKPALDEKKLDSRILRDIEKRHEEQISSVLRALLPKQMVRPALHYCDMDGSRKAGLMSSHERKMLVRWLKNFRLVIDGYRPLREAIVTAGGVSVKEITPETMESKITHGLFLTGELLDIHGETGGYNLQAAFSTGWLAGISAARDT